MIGRILMIDNEPDQRGLIRRKLAEEGYEVSVASDGEKGLQLLKAQRPHLVLLDTMMPGKDRWETCRGIRHLSTVPIILLIAQDSTADGIQGLRIGADDFLSKPVDLQELAARIEAAIRRARMPAPANDVPLCFDGDHLIIDRSNCRVTAYNREVNLSPKEYALLVYLAERAGQVLPVRLIYENVWSLESDARMESVKWYIWRVRNKIEADSSRPRFILTERGVGYRFANL